MLAKMQEIGAASKMCITPPPVRALRIKCVKRPFSFAV